jgi:membrane fusion protein, heavy metal efflux system
MKKRTLAIAGICLICAYCAKTDAKNQAGAGIRPPAENTADVRPMITIPRGSPQMDHLTIEPAGTAVIPGNEVVAPGRIDFDPGRVSRILLPVPGRLQRVLVRWGDRVTDGQPLFTIDSPDAEQALSEFKKAESAVSQTRSTLARAEADDARTRELYDHKAVAKKEVLASGNELILAREELAGAEAGREQARRRLEILGLNAEDAGHQVTVRSPLAGKVIDMAVTAGEYINDTSTPVMTVANLDVVWVTSAIPENMIRFVEVGEHIEVELVAYPGETFKARVTKIADILDPKSRTVQVRAELANPGGRFKPEMFGRIRHSHDLRSVPVVPARAILHRGTEVDIYVERRPGVFERVPVVLGAPRGDMIPVLSGIQPGDRVVVGGGMSLVGMETR